MNLGHLVDDGNRLADADELTLILDVGEKAAQVFEQRLVAAQQGRGLQGTILKSVSA
jgi:hypothetical protein